MEVNTDSIIAFMSFLVGSYLFISNNVKFEMPKNKKIFFAKLKKEKEIKKKIEYQKVEQKVDNLFGNLFGMNNNIEKDKGNLKDLLKQKQELE